jgi:hypothetical protein
MFDVCLSLKKPGRVRDLCFLVALDWLGRICASRVSLGCVFLDVCLMLQTPPLLNDLCVFAQAAEV